MIRLLFFVSMGLLMLAFPPLLIPWFLTWWAWGKVEKWIQGRHRSAT